MVPHELVEMAVIEACDGAEPGIDTWLYTVGARHGLGPELVAPTRADADDGIQLGVVELDACLRQWEHQRAAGQSLGEVLIYDGLVVVHPTELAPLDAERLAQTSDAHLCMLEDEDVVGVVRWSATLDPDVLQVQTVDANLVDQQVRTCLGITADGPQLPGWEQLLRHLDPACTTYDVAKRVAQIGALGATQQMLRGGATAHLPRLRTIAAALDLDVERLCRTAQEHAARWAYELWPPDHDAFERRWHRPSVALAHALEATALALKLYPNVPFDVMNPAMSTTMHVLGDGRWAAGSGRLDLTAELADELAELSATAWESLARTCLAASHQDDIWAHRALAQLTALGQRPPAPSEFDQVVPDYLDHDARTAIQHAAASAATSRAAGLLACDPVTTHLVARSMFTK